MHVTGAKRGEIVVEKLSYYCRVKSLTQVLGHLQRTDTVKTRVEGPIIAWENSRHLATLPLVSPPNDVWETSAEIPYWWRVTTPIWIVLLIGGAAWKIWFNQRISVLVSQTSFGGETSGSVAKCRLFSQAKEPTVFEVWENRLLYFGVVIGNLG